MAQEASTKRGLDREAVKQAVHIVQEQAAAPPPPAPSVSVKEPDLKTEVGAQETVAQSVPETGVGAQGTVARSVSGAETEAEKVIITPPDTTPRLSDIYDPMPNLRAALTRLEKIRPDRFADIVAHTRNDVRALLDEIVSRSQYFLEQLEDDTES